jgi:aminoglycoside phosphotransferase (APT) family kinase protein
MLSELTQSLVDPGIATLQAVLDPRELAKHLEPALPVHWGRVQDIRIRVLQHHRARRCTVDIMLQTASGTQGLIGKVYAEDRSDVYQAMKEMTRSGFGPEAEFSIPQPFAFIPELNLLLQERIQGRSATEVFLKGNESERAKAAERCARWLAHFHMQAPLSRPVFALSHELLAHWMRQRPLERWMRRIPKRAGAQAKQLMEKVVLLFNRLEIAAVKHDRVEMCACHGSYCHYQIILNETRTVTLDWDSFCVTHPSLDVARFITILQQLALDTEGSLKGLDVVSEAFYKSYIATNGHGVAKQLAFYKAAHFLKHSRDYLKRDNVRPEMAGLMLDEGLRVLAEEM